jgi:hypothetical protein
MAGQFWIVDTVTQGCFYFLSITSKKMESYELHVHERRKKKELFSRSCKCEPIFSFFESGLSDQVLGEHPYLDRLYCIKIRASSFFPLK